MRIVIVLSIIFTTFNVIAQSLIPDAKELEVLDSLVMSRFKESQCYDSTEAYELFHIYEYRYITGKIDKSDFVDKSILSKIEIAYFDKFDLIPQTVPFHQYSLIEYIEKQPDPARARDSLISLSQFYDVSKNKDKNLENISCIRVYETFIANGSVSLVGVWYPLDDWVGCMNPMKKKHQLFKMDLFEILKDKEYEIVFHLNKTAWGDFVAVKKNGDIKVLTVSLKENVGVRIVTIEELVTDYWDKFDFSD